MISDDKGWTMLAGDEDADAMVDRYIAARTPKGTRPLHAELRAENEYLRLSLLTMAARERETAAERDALRTMLAEAREALRALLAAEREKTERSVPMESILAARDLFEMGSAEYDAIDDILAGKWTVTS